MHFFPLLYPSLIEIKKINRSAGGLEVEKMLFV